MTEQPTAIEYGRMQILTSAEADTATLIVDNVNREVEHWLMLASLEGPHTPSGSSGCGRFETWERLRADKCLK